MHTADTHSTYTTQTLNSRHTAHTTEFAHSTTAACGTSLLRRTSARPPRARRCVCECVCMRGGGLVLRLIPAASYCCCWGVLGLVERCCRRHTPVILATPAGDAHQVGLRRLGTAGRLEAGELGCSAGAGAPDQALRFELQRWRACGAPHAPELTSAAPHAPPWLRLHRCIPVERLVGL